MIEVDGMMAADTAGLAVQRYVVNAISTPRVQFKQRNILTLHLAN